MQNVMDFCLLLKIWAKIGKNINKNVSNKYSKNFSIMLNNPQLCLKLLQKSNSKNSGSNCWFVWQKIANKITMVSRMSLQYSSETVTNEVRKNWPLWRNTLRKIYIFRKKTANYWWFKINRIIYWWNIKQMNLNLELKIGLK